MSACLKIGTHGILEELISNLELDFRNFNPKIHFWASLGRKSIPLIGDPLLFLGIKLVLVVYFKIASHSSDAFYMRF